MTNLDDDMARLRALLDSPRARRFAMYHRPATRLGHSVECICGDCGYDAALRHIQEMECELGLCDHGPNERHVTKTPPDPRPRRLR